MQSKRRVTVTAAIIWHECEVLITKRPRGTHLEGFWEFPGGKKEVAESLEECIAREIKEELGIDVDPEKLLLTVSHEYETKVVDLYVFECRLLNGSPLPMEGQEIKWVRPRDMSGYAFPPPDIEIIEYLCHKRSNIC